MKNNPNTKYVLIGLVVLIWGMIIYKVVKGLSGDDVVLPSVAIKLPEKPFADSGYQLLTAAYPNPFSNELVTEEELIDGDSLLAPGTPNSPPPAVNNNAATPAMPPAPPPAIIYNGYIYNPVTKKRTALISFNGRSMIVSPAEKLDGATRIVKIDKQELTYRFNGQMITVKVGG